MDPDFEFRGTVGGLEEGRIARGAQQFREVFEEEDLDAWDERRFEPEDFIDAGDRVVVLQREYRRGRGSGVELETQTAVVFEVRDGRVVRIQGYMDRALALEAVGLTEQTLSRTFPELGPAVAKATPRPRRGATRPAHP